MFLYLKLFIIPKMIKGQNKSSVVGCKKKEEKKGTY